MRVRALLLLLAVLVACRARARREDDPVDAAVPEDRALSDEAPSDAGDPIALERRMFRVIAGARSTVIARAADGAAREGETLEASGGERIALVGRAGEVVELGGEGARYTVRGDGAVIELPAGRGVAGVILGGAVEARVPRLAGAPLRFDTAEGRVILGAGEALIRVGAAWTEVQSRDAAVTVWAAGAGEVPSAEALPARGTRRWPSAREEPCARASRDLEAAAGLLSGSDAGGDERALGRASMALGRASGWIGRAGRAGGDAGRCETGLRGRRDALAARLAELSR